MIKPKEKLVQGAGTAFGREGLSQTIFWMKRVKGEKVLKKGALIRGRNLTGKDDELGESDALLFNFLAYKVLQSL